MKNIFLNIIFFTFLALFGSCKSNTAIIVNDSVARVQPTVEPNTNVGSNQKNAADENSFECVRAEPEPIIKKEVFPKTTFRLEKNEEFPFQNLGYETVEFENGDKLLIENVGCENFTLNFHFQTERFTEDTDNAQFWYKTAVQLVEQTKKGIKADTPLIFAGTKALRKYVDRNKKPEFREEIDFCGTDMRCVVTFDKIEKSEDGKVKIVLSYGIGPL